MSEAPLLIAGIGNIFLGDDAFGVEVVQRLAQRPLPAGAQVVDFGIRGLDLTYALLDEGCNAAILVDAVSRGGAPGTLYVLEPEADPAAGDPAEIEPGEVLLDTHNMDPARVLRLVGAMGGRLDRLLLVGCEPGPATTAEEMAAGLSEPVRAAVDGAVARVESLAGQMLPGPLASTARSNDNIA